jgi:hypothetical protein
VSRVMRERERKIEGVKTFAVRVSHIPGQGVRPPYGLDPSPYVDSASGFRTVRLFCVACDMLWLSCLGLCCPKA